MQLSEKTIHWLEDELEGEITETKPLEGGTSTRLWLVTLIHSHKNKTVVLREYTNKEWLAVEPDIAHKEVGNLLAASQVPLKTPELLASDPYAKKTTHPTIVFTYLEGEVLLEQVASPNQIEELAKTLAHLHKNNAEVPHHYFRYFDPKNDVTAAWSSQPDAWKEAFRYLNQTELPQEKHTFIHRDFHPTNVLFDQGKVSAVIDWQNACMGPKSFDVAHCRWNLVMLYGMKTADDFLNAYLKYSSLKTYDPYWDLEALGNVFSEEAPEVYAGWEFFGRTDITAEQIRMRMDAYLIQTLTKLK